MLCEAEEKVWAKDAESTNDHQLLVQQRNPQDSADQWDPGTKGKKKTAEKEEKEWDTIYRVEVLAELRSLRLIIVGALRMEVSMVHRHQLHIHMCNYIMHVFVLTPLNEISLKVGQPGYLVGKPAN